MHLYSRIYTLLALLFVSLSLGMGIAQIRYPANGFTQIDLNVGVQSIILRMFQDDRGFLWFGNDNGLYRYDGYRLKTYTYSPNDRNSLSASNVVFIYQENKEFLWVGINFGGVNRIHLPTDSITHFLHDPENDSTISSNRPYRIFRGDSGTLWFLTDSGIDKFVREKDPQTGQLKEYFLHPGNIITIDWETFLQTDWPELLNKNLHIWIVGFYVFDPRTEVCYRVKTPIHLRLASGKRIQFTPYLSWLDEQNQVLWMTDAQGVLIRVDLNRRQADELPLQEWYPELGKFTINGIWQENSNRIWLFTEGRGILVVNLRKRTALQYYDDESANPLLHGNDPRAFLVDRSNILWVSTPKGMNKMPLKPPPFKLIKTFPEVPSGSPQNRVIRVCVDGENYLWISGNRRLHRMNIANGSIEYDLHKKWQDRGFPEGALVKTIFRDSRGDIWFGLNSPLAFRYRPSTGEVRRFILPGGNFKMVRSIMEDSRGRIWFGADFSDGGIFVLEPGSEKITALLPEPGNSNSPASDQVWCIYEDWKGRFWFGYWGAGLDMYDPRSGEFYHFRNRKDDPNSLSSNYVTCILETPDSTLWVGTWNGGLNRLIEFPDDESNRLYRGDSVKFRFHRYTDREGFTPDNQVVAMTYDPHGRLWMSTAVGISVFDPSTEQFRHFAEDDGVEGEFSAGAITYSSDGHLYFGSSSGVIECHPDSLAQNPHVPPVVFTELNMLGKPAHTDSSITYKKHIVIPYETKFFSVEFAALDYLAPEQNQYQYFLEGFDRDWVHIGNRRRVTFTNLDPGHYVLRVRASNNDGVWNETGAWLHITITPPWYLTRWAYLLYGILGVMLVLAGRWVVVNRKSLMNLRARKISHYKLLNVLGEGGMGTVYKAVDLNSRKIVALKLLNEELLKDPENRKRFANEGRLLKSFSHPRMVAVYEIGETETQGFIAMEYLTGGTLKAYLEKNHPLPLEEIKRLLLQIADGLKAIHDRGIIHRDIKCGNIMLDDQCNVRIMDFGLSKSHLATMMTTLGTVIGTLGYVAPEQITGVNVDQRVDIFSFGVMMYELLTNRMPFTGENEIAMIHSIFNTEPPPPSCLREGGLPEAWNRLVMRCLAKDPRKRFQSIEEIITALERV